METSGGCVASRRSRSDGSMVSRGGPTGQPVRQRARGQLTREVEVATHTRESPGESQARRLEHVHEQVASLLGQPGVAARLRTSPGENEWSAMQTLGHMTEMIPYWLHHCRALIAATGAPPTFGRTAGSPERLAGVAHGASVAPDALLAQLSREVHAAAATIRQLSPAER